jgi:hypothetical protein
MYRNIYVCVCVWSIEAKFCALGSYRLVDLRGRINFLAASAHVLIVCVCVCVCVACWAPGIARLVTANCNISHTQPWWSACGTYVHLHLKNLTHVSQSQFKTATGITSRCQYQQIQVLKVRKWEAFGNWVSVTYEFDIKIPQTWKFVVSWSYTFL